MRTFFRATVLIAGMLLLLLTLPAPSAASTSARDKFVAGVVPRTDNGKYKRAFCVCMGGTQNSKLGLIQAGSFANANIEYFYAICLAQTFDRTTGEFVSGTQCDGTWIPLSK